MISVEANIGAGKSTFLRELSKRWPDMFNVIYEPLEEWQKKFSDVDNNILGMFYGDIERWSYTFQSNAFITRIQKYESEKDENKINLTERSVYSDNRLFAQMLRDDGKMNDIEWKLYDNWFSWLTGTFNAKPDSIIYLRCDPEIAYERVVKRHRSEEESVSLDYLKRLHKYHDDWLLNEKDIQVKVVNVDVDFEGNDERIRDIFMEIFELECYNSDGCAADGAL